ncbi:hypothetical protein COCSUDRAFT_62268 [Coccomyxa subellipsoidea C-169]|uniref:Collagen-like protein n=1 Tax=Coccomyxa subellipsoidea (strain C-169) TaxID=574566 RepID=I0Z2J0_COCSC|nr:hypothetical protein COCSUDRAFT_62268 [Coccomyxa subellipsoidea C-169]EIE24859.1 hypothetical protein COCSUDRAFT_62268 [Coccomyxa subellipsoidea C-169]|eukprot:XP_005649403.1 hypothetical protein COCSUDRAFT_62268 [Coccomyxa subellipsoidea C-169]
MSSRGQQDPQALKGPLAWEAQGPAAGLDSRAHKSPRATVLFHTGVLRAWAYSGATGVTGVGTTGPKGDKGDKGDTGPFGATGASGTDGATGASGAVGNTGATGDNGPTGVTGAGAGSGATGNFLVGGDLSVVGASNLAAPVTITDPQPGAAIAFKVIGSSSFGVVTPNTAIISAAGQVQINNPTPSALAVAGGGIFNGALVAAGSAQPFNVAGTGAVTVGSTLSVTGQSTLGVANFNGIATFNGGIFAPAATPTSRVTIGPGAFDANSVLAVNGQVTIEPGGPFATSLRAAGRSQLERVLLGIGLYTLPYSATIDQTATPVTVPQGTTHIIATVTQSGTLYLPFPPAFDLYVGQSILIIFPSGQTADLTIKCDPTSQEDSLAARLSS